MDVDRRTLAGADPVPHLDIGKDQVHVRKSPRLLVLSDCNIRIDTVVVSDAYGANAGRGAFELRKKLFPRILAAVLIVEDRSRRVKMGIPAMPFGTLWVRLSKHCYPLLLPVVALVTRHQQ